VVCFRLGWLGLKNFVLPMERYTGIAFVWAAVLALSTGAPSFAASADEHFRRALECRFRGDTDAAIVEYRRGLQVNPSNVLARDQLGMLLLDEKGDVDGAISEFMTALSLLPRCSSCELHLNEALDRRNAKASDQVTRGNQFYSAGDFPRATAAYRIAVANEPDDAVARNSLAWTLYKIGRIDEGLAEVKLALEKRPDDPEFVNTLACLLFDKGEVDQAIAEWKRAIALSKTPSAPDLYGIALGLLKKGDTAGAAKYFSDAIKVDPRYADVVHVRDRVGMSVSSLTGHERLLSLVKKDK
jgi:tetratricopeptide (TPR) repeat protein